MKPLPVAAALLIAAAAATAQYKVVGADGRVTYTDRPAAEAGSKVSQVGRDAAASPAAAPSASALLPYGLRQVAARFPVTLYAAPDCAPCERGRQLLQRRGVPYTERLVQTDEDQVALERLTGARTVPVLAVGAQFTRGWLGSEWQANLDLAGYPAQSRLPSGWQAPSVTPLAPRPPAPPPVAVVPPTAEPPPEPIEPQGLRF